MKKLIILFVVMILAIPFNVCAEEEEPTIYERAYADVFTYEETDLPYRYVLPEDYTPEKQYPLVVFLHAENEVGVDNASQLRHCVDYIRIKLPQSIIVAPQCSPGNQWVDTPLEGGNYSVSQVPESNELQAVMALLEKIKGDLSIDADRVSAIGVSMGGYGVWDLLTRHNESFASGVILCGGGDPSQAQVLKDTPIYIFHGKEDEVVSVSAAKDMIQSIIDVDGTKVRFYEIEDSPHGLCYELYFSSGVIETLSTDKISDKNIEQEDGEKEESSDVKVVVDAGIAEKPSKMKFFIFIGAPFVLATVGVIYVLRKVKF